MTYIEWWYTFRKWQFIISGGLFIVPDSPGENYEWNSQITSQHVPIFLTYQTISRGKMQNSLCSTIQF